MLRRHREWIAKLNIAERLAALACIAAVLAPFLTQGPSSQDFENQTPVREILLGLLLLPLGLAVMFPCVAAPQLGIFFLVRRSRFKLLSYGMVAVSVVLLTFYFFFLRGADLSSSSTAALAVPFYPLWQAMYALPLLAAVQWTVHRLLPAQSEQS
jgi:hypothetical protein